MAAASRADVTDRDTALARALRSLEGLSVGDAFGEACLVDDTVMGISVVETLEEHGGIDQDALARRFGHKLRLDPWRGYGRVTHQILTEIARGGDWRTLSAAAFDGIGSMGNGGAMRAGPIGAYFAGDLEMAAEQARLAAAVTHANAEGQAGAMAVAAAAAWAAGGGTDPDALFAAVLEVVPAGITRDTIERASSIGPDVEVLDVVTEIGNGIHALTQDTVPFALWSVRHHLRGTNRRSGRRRPLWATATPCAPSWGASWSWFPAPPGSPRRGGRGASV